jgi:hypothetical protein
MSNTPAELVDHVASRIESGSEFFRATKIAEETGLKPRQVGYYLANTLGKEPEFEVRKWSRSRSTTWRITRNA